jgi:uncharacterized membrane protein YtjA (UPF0391 family)
MNFREGAFFPMMKWCTVALVIVAAMASVLGLAGIEKETSSALSTLQYVFVALFGFCFFVLMHPRKGRHHPMGRRPHSRHE